MNVYDFDNTLLRGDSSVLYFLYNLKRHPRMWAELPVYGAYALGYKLGIISKKQMKQKLFSHFRFIRNPQANLAAFWEKTLPRLKGFYPPIAKADDVVISASPEFLIRPACVHLGIRHIMGSPVDSKTGVYAGENCHGAQKVKRFYERFPEGHIDEFYSDSHSDDPLAALAEKAFLVKKERLEKWQKQS